MMIHQKHPPSTFPEVSVIVPAYNAEKYLDQCLSSIANQTLEEIEIFARNDGSTDNTLSIIDSHAKSDYRFTAADQDNHGYGATCNLALSQAYGEWIAIVEPDDWIAPDMLESMVNFANECESKYKIKPDIIKTPWFKVNPETGDESDCGLREWYKTTLKPFSVSKKPMLLGEHPSIWSCLYRRSYLVKNNIKFPEYPGAGWADNPFLIDTMCQTDKIIYLDKPFYHYRVFDKPPSATSKEQINLPGQRWITMSEKLKKLGIKDKTVLYAHYLRGFNYVYDIIDSLGLENKYVQEMIDSVFAEMEPKFALNNPFIEEEKKKFFAEQIGYTKNIPKCIIGRAVNKARRLVKI